MNFKMTEHFNERILDRRLKSEILEFILVWGTAVHSAGVQHLVIVRKTLPEDLQETELTRIAMQWVIVLDRSGRELITCYRNDDPHKFVKSKPRDFQDAFGRRESRRHNKKYGDFRCDL